MGCCCCYVCARDDDDDDDNKMPTASDSSVDVGDMQRNKIKDSTGLWHWQDIYLQWLSQWYAGETRKGLNSKKIYSGKVLIRHLVFSKVFGM